MQVEYFQEIFNIIQIENSSHFAFVQYSNFFFLNCAFILWKREIK